MFGTMNLGLGLGPQYQGGAGGGQAPDPGATDPYFSNVVLLAGFEGPDGATTFTDESNSAHTMTASGATIDTAQFKFGTSSALFLPSNHKIIVGHSADLNLSASNSDQFTMEAFIRKIGNLGGQTILVKGATGSGSAEYFLQTSGTSIRFLAALNGTSYAIDSGLVGSITTDQWYHVAVDKDASGKIRVYLDGVMIYGATPASSAFFQGTEDAQIGLQGVGSSDFNGWIDELRITKGIARYASDAGFSVPTEAFPRS